MIDWSLELRPASRHFKRFPPPASAFPSPDGGPAPSVGAVWFPSHSRPGETRRGSELPGRAAGTWRNGRAPAAEGRGSRSGAGGRSLAAVAVQGNGSAGMLVLESWALCQYGLWASFYKSEKLDFDPPRPHPPFLILRVTCKGWLCCFSHRHTSSLTIVY